MDRETKDTLKRVAEYAVEGEKRARSKVVYAALGIVITMFLSTILFADERAGLLHGIVPDAICNMILVFVYVSAGALLLSYLRVYWALEKPSMEPKQTVAATVASKEVKSGAHGTGRSMMGYSFVVNFRTEDGQTLELYAYEIEFGKLKEGMKGTLIYQGRYFVGFDESE